MSIDYADYVTEQRRKALEKRLKKEYQKAYDEMCDKWDQYINGYDDIDFKSGKTFHHKSLKERYDEELAKFKSGNSGYKDQAEFNAWYQTQIQRGLGYQRMADNMALGVVQANQRASAYINDDAYAIYALNANYQAYQISKEYDGIDFQLYSEDTIKELTTGANHVEFRTNTIDPERNYAWNREKINSALISGILQGKSIDKLTDSFAVVMGRNEASAVRNARTSLTSAQNGGRQATAERALKMGIHSKKKWLAVGDERTRFSHAMLNGQIREINEVFSNGLMYPADPTGTPAEVYNCRCKRLFVLPKYEDTTSNEIYDAWENLSEEQRKAEKNAYNKWAKDQKKKHELSKQLRSEGKDNTGIYQRSTYNFDPFPRMGFNILDQKESVFQSLGKVNPNYKNAKKAKDGKWTKNCQRCAVTFEMRQRGYDVSAKPKTWDSNGKDKIAQTILKSGKPNSESWLKAFENGAQNIKCVGVTNDEAQTIANILHEMGNNGDGSRAILRIRWKGKGASGHLVNVVNENGAIHIYDSQSGVERSIIDIITRAKPEETYLLRTDKLKLTEGVKECAQ